MILCVNSIYVILEYNQVFNLLDGILETELWQNENSGEVHQEHTEECPESIAVQEVDDSDNEIQDVDDSEEDIIQDIKNSDDGIQKKMELMEVEDISD